MVNAIKFILQMIGLAVIVWFVWIAAEEFIKIRKEQDNGQSHG